MIENRNLYDIYIEKSAEKTVTLNSTTQSLTPTFWTDKEFTVSEYNHQDTSVPNMIAYSTYQNLQTDLREIFLLKGLTKSINDDIIIDMKRTYDLYFGYGDKYNEIFDKPLSGTYYELLVNTILHGSLILRVVLNGVVLTDNYYSINTRTFGMTQMDFIRIDIDCPYLKNFGNQITVYWNYSTIPIGSLDNATFTYYDYTEPDLTTSLIGGIMLIEYLSNENTIKVNANDFSLSSSRENLNKDNHNKRLSSVISTSNTRELSFSYYIQSVDDSYIGDYLDTFGIYQNDTEFRIIRISTELNKVEIYEGCRYINDAQFSEQLEANQLQYSIQYQKRIRATLSNPLTNMEVD